jgi:Putative porin
VRLKGNTLININAPGSTANATWGLASEFRPIHLSAGLGMRVFDPYVLNFGFDWVENTAFDIAGIRQRSGLPTLELDGKTSGVQASVEFGKARLNLFGDWTVGATFRRIERDAWLDGFTDTTWHLGGTNYQGWQIGGLYAIDRYLALGIRYTSTRNLDDGARTTSGNPPVTTGNLSSAPLKIDVLQVDLNAWF